MKPIGQNEHTHFPYKFVIKPISDLIMLKILIIPFKSGNPTFLFKQIDVARY